MLHWEADLPVMSAAGYLSEVEVKMNLTDLKNDAGKSKWRLDGIGRGPRSIMKAFWYAMPAKLATREDVAAIVPEWAGIMACRVIRAEWQNGRVDRFWRADIVRKPKQNRKAPKYGDATRCKMARLGVLRYWSLVNKETRPK